MSGASGGWCENPVGSADVLAFDPESWVDANGNTIDDFVAGGALASIYSHTIGTIWTAATGTVDAKGKDVLIRQEMIDLMRAGGAQGLTWQDAYNQAFQDVTGVLKAAKSDPDCASLGNNPGLANLKMWLEIGVGMVALYILWQIVVDLEIVKGETHGT